MAKSGCPSPGCRGQGHAKGYDFATHDQIADCPYAPQNLDNDLLKPDRLRSMRRPQGPSSGRSLSTDSENAMR